MIENLTIVKFVKHQNKSFNFTKGLNTITGANEAGKSLVLECIKFVLFGSQALRLPANTYDPKTEAALTLSIRGNQYIVGRTLKSATLTKDGELLAKSTSVVNQQICKLLGYGYDVFEVANSASQNEINYLTTLKPTERKKMIDKTLGLFATKQVIENHKSELRNLKSNLSSIEMFKPKKVEMLVVESDALFSKNAISEIEGEISKLMDKASRLREKLNQRERLQKDIDSIVVPVIDGEVPKGLEHNDIVNIQNRLFDLSTKEDQTRKTKELALKAFKENEKDIAKLSDSIKSTYDLIEKLGLTKEQVIKEIEHLSLAKTKQKLLSQGSIICESCKHENYLAHDQLSHIPEWVDVNFKRNNNLTSDDFDKVDAVIQKIVHLKGLQEGVYSDNVEQAEKNFTSAWNEKQNFCIENAETLEFAEQYKKILKDIPARDKALEKIATLKEQLLNIEEVNIKDINDIGNEIAKYNSAIQTHKDTIKLYEDYIDYQEKEKDYALKVKSINESIDKEVKILETLDILLNSIRNEMLPRINIVASSWIKKLSGGSHYSVQLTDDMEMLMDDTPLDAFSGSGKAIAHIALRLSLAQILTRGVFPVFMGDEIDASMDKERSPATLRAFKEMLELTTEQIILISHQDLNLRLDADNSIQL